MTRQVSNIVTYKKKNFRLVGYTEGGLFKLENYGLKPRRITSACWRGYISTYEITEDSRFKLKALRLFVYMFDKTDKLKSINEIAPSVKEMTDDCKVIDYVDVDFDFEYSGFVLIGNDYLNGLYRNMKFHNASKYREIYELEIQKGKLISAINLSEKMAEYRELINEKETNPSKLPSQKKTDMDAWIETIDQKYNTKK